MATAVVLPKQGNTVESCIIVAWKKEAGDHIAAGDVLCEVETDKATFEVESTASGTLLARFFEEGEDVPVLAPIAAIGMPGDDISFLKPATIGADSPETQAFEAVASGEAAVLEVTSSQIAGSMPGQGPGIAGASPRARNLAQQKGIEIAAIKGTGPGGRIIERDVQAALSEQPRLTPVAERMVRQGDFGVPVRGSGLGGRITSKDLVPKPALTLGPATAADSSRRVQRIPLQSVRKVIAERMLQSLQTTAQLTLNRSADARAILAYRKQLKESSEILGLREVTINDLILFVVSRTLAYYPELNALFDGEAILQYSDIHLASAVDTPRGLMAPVIRNAGRLNLKQISQEAKRLATACLEGRVTPDELAGGTFTVSNLGAYGVESFTPILNPPQVAILGVGNINLKAVDVGGEVQFIPHIGFSLTVNHQVVDGAPGARFLQALAINLSDLELMLAT